MRRLTRLTVYALCGFMAVAPAAMAPAQIKVLAGDQMRRVLQKYAECTVKRNFAHAKNVVLVPLTYAQIVRQYPDLLTYHCYPEGGEARSLRYVQFSYPMVHMILAEALVRREYGQTGPANIAPAPEMEPIPVDSLSPKKLRKLNKRQSEVYAATQAQFARWQLIQRMGICVAGRAPSTVFNLAMSEVGSAAETSALAELGPAVAKCVPDGSSRNLKPADIRGSAVLGYYRLAQRSLAIAATGARESR